MEQLVAIVETPEGSVYDLYVIIGSSIKEDSIGSSITLSFLVFSSSKFILNSPAFSQQELSWLSSA